MRREDEETLDAIRDALDAGSETSKRGVALMHKAEDWRTRLLDGGDAALTALATWLLSDDLAALLPDISDATVGPDGRLYLLSDQGSGIVRLPDVLDPRGGTLESVAAWRIAGQPRGAEGLVILDDGTVLVGLDTKAAKRNLLRLDPLPLD